jgi:predicted nucleic acid-binding protein
MIVADAASVIAFARLGRLALLQHIVGELVVPEAVYDDLVVKGRGKPGAAEVAESTWIQRESIRNREATAHSPPVLGAGEREAIVLAAEHHAALLTDGQRARETTEELGLEVVGVLWVLIMRSIPCSSGVIQALTIQSQPEFCYADLPNYIKHLGLNVTQPDEECARCQLTS